MRKYNAYHTILKQLVKRGTLPGKYLNMIDRSVIWRWKQDFSDKYIGTELGNIEVLEQFISRSESERVMRIYLKIASMFSGMLTRSATFHSILKQNLKEFVSMLVR
ncbi:MAG TPA: hypothetical protein VJ963_12480 [Bacteroidales bacterium]|nr:hypothetical protein [Bacteroidales bacterium]